MTKDLILCLLLSLYVLSVSSLCGDHRGSRLHCLVHIPQHKAQKLKCRLPLFRLHMQSWTFLFYLNFSYFEILPTYVCVRIQVGSTFFCVFATVVAEHLGKHARNSLTKVRPSVTLRSSRVSLALEAPSYNPSPF